MVARSPGGGAEGACVTLPDDGRVAGALREGCVGPPVEGGGKERAFSGGGGGGKAETDSTNRFTNVTWKVGYVQISRAPFVARPLGQP